MPPNVEVNLDIIVYPNKILNTVCEDIKKDETFQRETMLQYCEVNHGLGLALPQIGITKRGFVMLYGGEKYIVINPKIINHSSDKNILSKEYCFSEPGYEGNVKRRNVIEVEYYDEFFNKKIDKFNGKLSKIFQHEYDHLDGIFLHNK